MKAPSFDKGIKIRKAVLGAEHVETPLRNDCTREEGREVLLQAAVYCGVPAAVDAFRSAKEAFAALDEDAAATWSADREITTLPPDIDVASASRTTR